MNLLKIKLDSHEKLVADLVNRVGDHNGHASKLASNVNSSLPFCAVQRIVVADGKLSLRKRVAPIPIGKF